MKILFIVPYPPGQSPSQRFRFEQYLPLLQPEGHHYEIHSFLQESNWRLFFSRGRVIRKALTVIAASFRRVLLLARIGKFDRVFIHREVAPLGPPVFEWIVARVLKKKIIYDFDDAIWLTDRTNENSISRYLRWRHKVGSICRMSYRVSCGNSYLAGYASKYNKEVVVNPTTIDTNLRETSTKKKSAAGRLTIGWTGSRTTLKYLEHLGPVISGLVEKYPHVAFCVIADEPPPFHWPATEFIPWALDTEIPDLLRFDIGVMPLPDDDWSKGKCGFKALQYMALEIPTVASPVGVNVEIIHHGADGFLASTPAEWFELLERLINDEALRAELGSAGRQTVHDRYSVTSNTARFLSILR